jgi:hypothetical protein
MSSGQRCGKIYVPFGTMTGMLTWCAASFAGMNCSFTVLRAKNIYGPYEARIVLHQGNTGINGPLGKRMAHDGG